MFRIIIKVLLKFSGEASSDGLRVCVSFNPVDHHREFHFRYGAQLLKSGNVTAPKVKMGQSLGDQFALVKKLGGGNHPFVIT